MTSPAPIPSPRLGATERVAFGGSEVTEVRINAAGLRGPDPGPPADGEIVVIGDSQVFDLGVHEHQTAATVLGEILHRPVLDAGVSTYGPPEYAAVIEETFCARKPAVVVYVVRSRSRWIPSRSIVSYGFGSKGYIKKPTPKTEGRMGRSRRRAASSTPSYAGVVYLASP